MTPVVVPEVMRRNVLGAFGEDGRDWLVSLPAVLDACANRWSLTLEGPFAGLSFQYVTRATRADGTPAVLKVGVPCEERWTEADMLRLAGGDAAVRLYESDDELGALLLESIEPGHDLASRGEAGDERATEIAAMTMKRCFRTPSPGHRFPSLLRWARAFDDYAVRFGDTGSLPLADVDRARALFIELSDPRDEVVLHGDLHHFNILESEDRGWLMIDPKGVVGDRGYEVAPWLYNPNEFALLRWSNPHAVEQRRIAQFSEILGIERERIQLWGYAGAILSAVWSAGSTGHGGEAALAVAALLQP